MQRRQALSSQWVEVGRSDRWVVSLHRSHYLKSSALKQKVRDQQILTSGQAYDSLLMQFSFSNSLIITLLPANLISHLSKFRHIHSASIFTELWHWQSISPAAFPKPFAACLSFLTDAVHSLSCSGHGSYISKAHIYIFLIYFPFLCHEKPQTSWPKMCI